MIYVYEDLMKSWRNEWTGLWYIPFWSIKMFEVIWPTLNNFRLFAALTWTFTMWTLLNVQFIKSSKKKKILNVNGSPISEVRTSVVVCVYPYWASKCSFIHGEQSRIHSFHRCYTVYDTTSFFSQILIGNCAKSVLVNLMCNDFKETLFKKLFKTIWKTYQDKRIFKINKSLIYLNVFYHKLCTISSMNK